MLDTHELKMKGIKETCSLTKDLGGYYSGEYVEVFYDFNEDTIWGIYQYSLGQNQWTQYHDPSIIKIGNFCSPQTMQQLADKIKETVNNERFYHHELNKEQGAI